MKNKSKLKKIREKSKKTKVSFTLVSIFVTMVMGSFSKG